MVETSNAAATVASTPVETSAPTRHHARRFAGDIALALLASAIATAAMLGVSAVWEPPNVLTANVVRAVTMVLVLVILALAALLIRREARDRGLASGLRHRCAGLLLVAIIPAIYYGMPLISTRLWFGGISGDQIFRTQYLGRFADSWHLHDMTYIGTPPFYPAGWFWLGGRFAALLQLDGWEAMKPWSMLTLAFAAGCGLTLWRRVAPTRATALAVVTTFVVLASDAQEQYGAAMVLVLAPMTVVVWRAVRTGQGLILTGVYLGALAMTYTLYAGTTALTVILAALVARSTRMISWRAATRRVLIVAAISSALALIVWLPYLLAITHHATDPDGATKFLPVAGSMVWLPQLDGDPIGFICLIGFVWLVLRVHVNRYAQALTLGLVALYSWELLSMAASASNHTLLGFRTHAAMYPLYAAAAVFAAYDLPRAIGAVKSVAQHAATATRAVAVVGAILVIGVAQQGTFDFGSLLKAAYQDDSRTEPNDVDAVITAMTGRPRTETVVLSTENMVLSHYPYYGYIAAFPTYSNPLALRTERIAQIRQWARADTPEQLLAALDRSPVDRPDVFVLRPPADGSPPTYTLR